MGAPVPEGDEEEALAREEERLRQMPVKRFPYHVGYLATDEEIGSSPSRTNGVSPATGPPAGEPERHQKPTFDPTNRSPGVAPS